MAARHQSRASCAETRSQGRDFCRGATARAKRLLSDATLPVTEIAAIAGFGSLRRFNAVFAEVYKRPPSAIRRQVYASESLLWIDYSRIMCSPLYLYPKGTDRAFVLTLSAERALTGRRLRA